MLGPAHFSYAMSNTNCIVQEKLKYLTQQSSPKFCLQYQGA